MEHFDAADLPATTQIASAVASLGSIREDAGIFFARQLEFVRTKIYSAQRPAMRAFDLVPVTNETPAYAETVVTRVFDEVGIAKVISNYADDLPRADVKGSETTSRVKDIGDSYGYNVSELRASDATGANLPARKGEAARRAIDVKMNQLAMVGEAQYGLYGLLNHPNIGTTVGLNGDWLNPTTTAAQVLSDMLTLAQAIPMQSFGNHSATMMAMPIAQYGRIQSLFVADSSGKTVLAVFRENHPGIQVIPVYELAGAGTAGADVVIVAERSAENYAFDMPLPFTQLAAQPRNLELVVPCLARAAGVQVYYPLALTKAEGI